MKNLIIILIAVSLFSCKKEEVAPVSKTGKITIEFKATPEAKTYVTTINVTFLAHNKGAATQGSQAKYIVPASSNSFVLDTIVKADEIMVRIDSPMKIQPTAIIKYNDNEIFRKVYYSEELPVQINKTL